MAKEIYIKSSHKGHERIWKGTIEDLKKKVFGYTLECGHSWDRTINEDPKTAKSLVAALNKSADVCNRYYDWYQLSDVAEYERYSAAGNANVA